MSIISQQYRRLNVKPRWQVPLGVAEYIVAYNCRKYGLPVPVLAMPFWEGAGKKAYDISGKMNHGTLTNGTTWKGGKFGNALSFDGINDYVNVGNRASLNFEITDTFTMSLWIKCTSTATYITLLSKMDKTSPYSGYELFLLNGKIAMYLIKQYPVSYIEIDGLVAVNNGVWNNIVVTYNGSSQASGIDLYVNGLKISYTIAKNNLSGTIIVPESFEIGIREGTDYPYNGLIDNVQIYNRALTASQVKFLYDNPFFMYEMPEELWRSIISGNLFFLHG